MSSTEAFYECHSSDPRTLFCMATGQNDEEYPNDEKEPFKEYRNYTKELKPQNKHFKAEIVRRQTAYGLGTNVRPGSWNKDKLLAWLLSNPIPANQLNDLLFVKEQLSKLKEKIQNNNDFPSPDDLLPPKKRNKWRYSEAKRLLRDGIISGEITADMDAKDVYEMNDEYKKWPYKNFPANLSSLRTTVTCLYERMQSDCLAYGHDLALLKKLRANDPPPATPWHRSEAKYVLTQDVNHGKHKVMKPAELYQTRTEYQEFDLKTFRNHIYQEVDSRAKRTNRFIKKKRRNAVQRALQPTSQTGN